MGSARRHAALPLAFALGFAATALPPVPAASQGEDGEGAGPLEALNLDVRGLWTNEIAVETDGEAQKFETSVSPEVSADLPGGWRLTGIGRLRFEGVDRLAPGQPSQEFRAPWSRRLQVGDYVDAELRELYVDGFVGDTFVRLGKQQVVWGQADGLRVLDQVNPFDFREFVLPEFEDRRIPLWTANAEIPVGDALLQVLWIPDRTYDDVPAPGAPFAFTSPLVSPQPRPGVPFTIAEPDRPDDLLLDGDIGARVTAFVDGWDLSANYLFHHYDQAVYARRLTPGGVRIEPRYERSHLVGGSASNAFGDVTLRSEIALSTNRHFQATEPAAEDGVATGTEIGYVIGLDYTGVSDTLISGQVFQSTLVAYDEAIVRDRLETQVTLKIERDFFNDTLTLGGLLIHSLNDADGVIQLDVDYSLRSNVRLSAGADLFYGGRDGLFGEFRDASRVTAGFEIGF